VALPPQAVVKTVDMDEEMEKFAIETASLAMQTFDVEREMAAQIKKEFDKKYA
jgi:dynein light chain LC8-type